MAASENGSTRHGVTVDILKLADDDKEICMWKYLLETNYKEIDNYLKIKDVSISKDQYGDVYFASYPSSAEGKSSIVKILTRASSTLHALQLNSRPLNLPERGCKVYQVQNDDFWIVGQRNVVDAVAKTQLSNDSSTESDTNNADINQSWVNLELIDVHLTEEEQAIIILHDLWQLPSLKKELVKIEKDDEKFTVRVRIPKVPDSQELEYEIRKELKSKKGQIGFKQVSFNPREIKFLCTDPVYRYVDKNLNYKRPEICCVWYVKSDANLAKVYTKGDADANYNAEKIRNSIITGSMEVLPKYFSTEKMQKRLLELKQKYQNKVDVCSSSSFSTLHFISVAEQDHKFRQNLKLLIVTKTLETTKEHRLLLKSKVKELETKYSVTILEEENFRKVGWKIQGESSSVKAAFDELKANETTLPTKVKDYQTDADIKVVQSTLDEMVQTGLVSIAEVSSFRVSNPIDLRNSIPSYRWILPNGNDIKIVNADYAWLLKDAILLKTIEVSDRHGQASVYFNLNNSEVTLYLPPWKESVAKEKDILRSALDDLFKGKELERKSICLFLVLSLKEPEKIGWSWKKFLPEVLMALDRHNVIVPLLILGPSKNEFVRGSLLIQNYADMICRPRRIGTKVKIGQLAKMKCDVIVNSTHGDLNLNFGAVSGTILKLAGNKIQDECNAIMKQRTKSKLSSEDVAVTNGYDLDCRYVFHGALAIWTNQTLAKFVYNCLMEAESRKLSTIAFPSLGTGKLGYPADQVAKIMLQTVRKYADDNNIGSLKEVIFVIYEKDEAGNQAFQTEEKRQKQGNEKCVTTEKCPKPNLLRITVTGKNEKYVDHTFDQIEKKITETGTETEEQMNIEEPEPQEMERKVVPDPIDDENEYKEEKTKGKSTSKPELTSGSSTFDSTPQDTDDACYVNVRILTDESGSPHSALRQILKQHGIKSEQIIYCPDYPMKARLRFKKRTDANALIENMKNCPEYELRPGIPYAVVNIRAKLNRAIHKYLENEENCQLLQRWSGVEIVKEDDELVLTGDLTEISEARDILIRWKAHQGTEFSVDTKADSKGKYNKNRYDQEHEDKMRSISSKMSRADDSFSEPSVAGTSTTKYIKLDIQRKNEQGGSSYGNGNNTDMPKASVTKNEHHVQSQDKELHQNVHPNVPNEHATTPSFVEAGAIPKHSKSNQESVIAINTDTQVVKTTMACQKPDALPKKNIYPELQKENPDYVRKPNAKSNIPPKRVPTKPYLIAPGEETLMMTTKEGVKVFVYQGDICFLKVDCIVNSSNSNMKHKYGLSSAISIEAGQTMEDQCQRYLVDNGYLSSDAVCMTEPGLLSHYKKILHINAPIWDSSMKEEHFFDSLSNAVEISLQKANQEQLNSIGIPAISSGFGSAPAVIRNKAYPHGVIKFSEKNAKTMTIKEIHFIDIEPSVVDYIKAAFLYAVPEPTVNFVEKLKKIPQMIKERFTSDVRSYKGAGKSMQLQLHESNIVVIVCDGALSQALQHGHVRRFLTTSGCRDIKYNESAVVITEDKRFSGSSNSSKKCRTNGGQSFQKILAAKGKMNKRRKAGDVEDMLGGNELDFFHVFCAIMPKLNEKVHVYHSSEQAAFFKKVDECYMEVFRLAETYDVTHLCMPVLCRDFYECKTDWFLKTSVSNLMIKLKEFGRKRMKSHLMIVHVVTNADDTLFKILETEMLKDKEHVVETAL